MIHLVRSFYNIQADTIHFNSEDSHYLLRVRRVRLGDELILVAGQKRYSVTISESGKRHLVAKINNIDSIPLPQKIVTLILSVGERRAVELAIKNGVEAGAHHIVLVKSSRSNADISDFSNKIERLETILLSASSQSQRLFMPTIRLSTWDDMVEYRGTHYLFHPSGGSEGTVEIGDYSSVWIGPEGGFTDEEVERLKKHNATVISLPMPVLRMENGVTAALTKIFLSF
ncbi:16S rRNA (uracil(1498)-N(3))-methyltransferase [bacterium]|nr:16S rRNA (uracil(1498)-N(3))-methyltransferase [bacterium]